ncbi:MAG: polyprenyl synthetase family protein [Thermoplasmata archaeon]|nr:polyprenyl synthetase family protein [Thermoplasmata archaeon]
MIFPDDYKDRIKIINERLMDSLNVMEDQRLKAAMSHYPSAGGKRLRPLLATMVSEAVGGKADAALPFGVALEMVHNFTLVHDDVMDEDDTRRGIKTVHSAFGIPEAILAGDAMFARAFEIAIESDIEDARAIMLVEILARAVRLLAEGQQMDMDFENMDSVSSDEYLKMIERKTAVLYSAAAQGGAIAGGGTVAHQEALFEYGRLIGLGFQIMDDVLDLTSTREAFGKPVLNDIRNGKKTLIVVHALENLKGSQRDEFLAVLGKKDATESELVRAKEILEGIGAIDHASRIANEFVAKAKDQLSVLKDSDHKNALKTFADYMVLRKT